MKILKLKNFILHLYPGRAIPYINYSVTYSRWQLFNPAYIRVGPSDRKKEINLC